MVLGGMRRISLKRLALILSLLTIAYLLLHPVLLLSDSASYRAWVSFQIVIQLLALVTLYFVARSKLWAIVAFLTLTTIFFVINATFVNYGNITEHIVFISVFYLLVGSVIYGSRYELTKES